MKILDLKARELVAAIKSRKIKAEEVAQTYLQRIARVNLHINALVQSQTEMILNQAREIDKNLEKLSSKKLLGVPVTIKNTCAVLGYSPDKGCMGLVGKEQSKYDATVVSRLRKEGALILGLTNTPELSIGFETDNLVYGQTKNPYDLNRTPGGSSGGEAAILAAQGSLLGIGSDASGSLRVPAHNTGITTLKLTQGRIPFTGNFPLDSMGLFSQFISFGPMARFVDDITLVSPLLIGPDNFDPHVMPITWRHPHKVDIKKLKIAYYADDGIATPSADIVSSIHAVASVLKMAVKSVQEDRPAVLSEMEALLTNSIFLGGDEGEWLIDIFKKLNLESLSPLLLEFLELAKKSKLSITELRWSWIKFDQCRRAMLQFMNSYDVIICPVAATVAKEHGKSYKEIRDFSYSICYSLVNWPIVVVRVGESKEGLPIGVQIIAKPWREDVALAVAEFLETSLGGWQPSKLLESLSL